MIKDTSTKFKNDLAWGERAERWVKQYLSRWFNPIRKVEGYYKWYDLEGKYRGKWYAFEVKAEQYNKHHESNNICIEVEYNGKYSGINTTRADFWVHIFYDRDINRWVMMVVKVSELKKWLRANIGVWRKLEGGDNQLTKSIVLPIRSLYESGFTFVFLDSVGKPM